MVLRTQLEELPKRVLVERAESCGVRRASVLTHAELVDEILKLSIDNPSERSLARGFMGKARDLLSKMVERGLHLPEAAKFFASLPLPAWPKPPPPLPTVTLAEIYAAQGHVDRALSILDEVLSARPDSIEARDLKKKLLSAPREAMAASGASRPAPPPSSSSSAGNPNGGGQGDAPGGTDELVAVMASEGTIYAYWELLATTHALVEARHPGGSLVLRRVAFFLSGIDVQKEIVDIDVPSLSGERFLSGIRPGAEIRLSLGWKSGSSFLPLTQTIDLSSPRVASSRRLAFGVGQWNASTAKPVSRDALRDAKAALLKAHAAAGFKAPPSGSPSGTSS